MSVRDQSIRVAGKVADAAAIAHGLPVPGVAGVATEALLRDLLAVQDEQTERLRRLESGVQQLLDRPWKTAQMHVREAVLPGRSVDQVVRSLDRAGVDLREALATVPPSTRGRAYVGFDLAVVLLALGDAGASRMHAGEALSALTDLIEAEAWKEVVKVAGPRRIGKEWPDRRRLQRYRPEQSLRPFLAVEWLSFALAIAELTKDRHLIAEERQRFSSMNRSLYAVELQANGNRWALLHLEGMDVEHAEERFELAELPPVLRSWEADELPTLPTWWPMSGSYPPPSWWADD